MAKKLNSGDRDTSWVDVHNDELMVMLGIRCPNLQPRDPSVWTKTPREKKELKKMRLRHKHIKLTGGVCPIKSIPVMSKLIVQIIGKNVPKTTFSYECLQSDIPRILCQHVNEKGESIVRYYKWNGKEYSPKTLPFWK